MYQCLTDGLLENASSSTDDPYCIDGSATTVVREHISANAMTEQNIASKTLVKIAPTRQALSGNMSFGNAPLTI